MNPSDKDEEVMDIDDARVPESIRNNRDGPRFRTGDAGDILSE